MRIRALRNMKQGAASDDQRVAQKLLDIIRRDPRRSAAHYAEQAGITEERCTRILDELERLGALGAGPGRPTNEAN